MFCTVSSLGVAGEATLFIHFALLFRNVSICLNKLCSCFLMNRSLDANGRSVKDLSEAHEAAAAASAAAAAAGAAASGEQAAEGSSAVSRAS